MPQCAAFGCTNHTDTRKDISFHSLPNENRKPIRQAWIKAIRRETLPKVCFICAEHFDESCFDQSYDCKMKLMPGSSQVKRKLNKDAIPTIFTYKKVAYEWSLSKKRNDNKRQKMVRIFRIFTSINFFLLLERKTNLIGYFLCGIFSEVEIDP